MSTVLAIDTSENICSVAVFTDGELVEYIENNSSNAHSQHLFTQIEELTKCSGFTLQAMDAVAFCSGPGSYTGLRIGCSAAKAIAYSHNLKMLAISSLEIMAKGFLADQSIGEDDVICSMMDARRMEVYWQFFNSKGEAISEARPAILAEELEYAAMEKRHVHLIGSGVEKTSALNFFPTSSAYASNYLLAKNMGKSIFMALENQDFADVAYYEPQYLKDFYFHK